MASPFLRTLAYLLFAASYSLAFIPLALSPNQCRNHASSKKHTDLRCQHFWSQNHMHLVPIRERSCHRIAVYSFAQGSIVEEHDTIRVDIRTEDVDFQQSEAIKEDAIDLITKALYSEDPPTDTELSVVLCSDDFIKELNKNWRGKDSATDVLSFPQEDDDGVVLGDLVISIPTAMRQAEERGLQLRDELRILMLHGFLHLVGYDHETSEEDLQEMAGLEEKLIKRLGWKGQGLISNAAQQ